jgi:hypothetical protein
LALAAAEIVLTEVEKVVGSEQNDKLDWPKLPN